MSFFAAGFVELPRASRLIHFSDLLCVSLAGNPPHRASGVSPHCRTGQTNDPLYRYASGMVQASLVPLAFGMSADFYVVVAKVSSSTADGAVAAAALLLGCGGVVPGSRGPLRG